MLHYIMVELNSKPSETLFVGDTEVDIETARNDKVKVVAVTWGFRTKETLLNNQPDFIIDKPKDLLEGDKT